MSVVEDWIEKAAEEILRWSTRFPGAIDAPVIKAIIRRHCPFKPDTAYVEAKKYDSTLARVAGNIASGLVRRDDWTNVAHDAVDLAREIIREVKGEHE